jgi:hypothetical protein
VNFSYTDGHAKSAKVAQTFGNGSYDSQQWGIDIAYKWLNQSGQATWLGSDEASLPGKVQFQINNMNALLR